MTTIVFDGDSLAIDNAGLHGGTLMPVVKSWLLPNNVVATGIGDGAQISLMVEWYKDGADPEKFPASQRIATPWCELIIVKGDGLFRYERSAFPIQHGFNRCAFGTGKDFAYGALAMGATATEALHIAAHFDPTTGQGATIYKLKDVDDVGPTITKH